MPPRRVQPRQRSALAQRPAQRIQALCPIRTSSSRSTAQLSSTPQWAGRASIARSALRLRNTPITSAFRTGDPGQRSRVVLDDQIGNLRLVPVPSRQPWGRLLSIFDMKKSLRWSGDRTARNRSGGVRREAPRVSHAFKKLLRSGKN
jgi:hypothetical protein